MRNEFSHVRYGVCYFFSGLLVGSIMVVCWVFGGKSGHKMLYDLSKIKSPTAYKAEGLEEVKELYD